MKKTLLPLLALAAFAVSAHAADWFDAEIAALTGDLANETPTLAGGTSESHEDEGEGE